MSLNDYLEQLGLNVTAQDTLAEIVVNNAEVALKTGVIAATMLLFIFGIVLPQLFAGAKKPFLDPKQFQPAPLVKKTTLNHNTRRFRFALPDPNMVLGLPTGQHITFLLKGEDGKDVYRPYTPMTDDDQLGYVDFVIKVYPQGKMGQALDKMNIGDKLMLKGPRGRFQYQRNMKRSIGKAAWQSPIAIRLAQFV